MCEPCNNKGWLLTFNINLSRWTIEKCDECNVSLTTKQQEIKPMTNSCSNDHNSPYEGDELPCDGCGEDIPQRCDINSPDGHRFLCDDCYDPELEAGTLYLQKEIAKEVLDAVESAIWDTRLHYSQRIKRARLQAARKAIRDVFFREEDK